MKKINLFLVISFIASVCFAQSNSELLSYYNQLKNAGYSQDQIEQIAKQNGYDIKEIMGLPSSISGNASSKSLETKQQTQTNFTAASELSKFLVDTLKGNKVFGSKYFNNLTYDFSPQINIATPENYILGPGDELKIDLWGASEASYQAMLSRQGRINIEGVGPIYLNGYTLSKARERIKNYLSTIYKGITSEDLNEKVNIELSLSKSRSVFVSIVGQVNKPGLYTLNSLSNVIHGLYSAAGIAENGSYRSIELIRSKKVIDTVDLYSFFIEGKISNVFLQDHDIIRVPYYLSRVSLEGEVKTPGLYEIKKSENIADLLNFSGGLTAKAVTSSFFVNRIENSKTTSINTSKIDFNLMDGDQVKVYSISDQQENKVSISGEVITPGSYSLNSAGTVNELLDSANGLSDKAYRKKASLIRKDNNGESVIISIALDSTLKRAKNNMTLKAKDSLVVYSNDNFYLNDKIFIEGNVSSPGEKIFYKGMTLEDLISQADGISEEEDNLTFSIKSKDEKSNDYIVKKQNENLDLSLLGNLNLSPGDIVSILTKNKILPIRINVSGEVKRPGVYIQSKSQATISSILDDAGGITPYGSTSSIYIERSKNLNPLEDLVNDSIYQKTTSNESEKIYIPINNINLPVYFEDGDKLVIEPFKNVVEVTGEVLKPSIVEFKKGSVKDYLDKVGISSTGSKKHSLVIYPNKEVFAVKKFLFFKSYPKVIQGSQIIVGKKPERSKLTSQELISVTSGLSTLVIVLSSLLSAN